MPLKHVQCVKESQTPTYRSWAGMIKRCYDTNDVSYKRYGGRGITVCEEWRKSFETFYKDMGDRPEGLSLGRIDNNGMYCKSNCQWETRIEQASNRRSSHFLTFKGETCTIDEWSRRTGLKKTTIHMRVKYGWSTDKILSELTHKYGNTINNHPITHNGKTQTITEWAKELGINRSTLFARIRNGWSPERALAK